MADDKSGYLAVLSDLAAMPKVAYLLSRNHNPLKGTSGSLNIMWTTNRMWQDSLAIVRSLKQVMWAGQLSHYSDWLRAGRSGNRIPMGTRFSAPVQTDPGAHPASSTMGTGSFPGVKSGRDVTLTSHPLLVPWSRKSRAIHLLPLWAVRPVQSLGAWTRGHFTFLP